MLERRDGDLVAGLRLAQDEIDAVRPASGEQAREREERTLADLRLPAADRAAATGRSARVDREMADLAAVAGDPVSGRPPMIDPPPTPTSPET